MIEEKDLEKLFSGASPGKRSFSKELLRYLLIFAAISCLVFVIINFSAIYNILQYWYKSEIKLSDNSSNYEPAIVSSPSSRNIIPKNSLPNFADNHIFIPKIDIDAPITWQVENTDQAVQNALEKGVVQLRGTSLPGERGNVFLTGHSSNYLWAKGGYKNIFALLGRLVVGDLAYAKYKNKLYIYRTTSIKVVKPDDTSVLGAQDGSYLTLMTCTPVGTSLNRLIIKADQVDPNPNTNFGGNEAQSTTLPKGVR